MDFIPYIPTWLPDQLGLVSADAAAPPHTTDYTAVLQFTTPGGSQPSVLLLENPGVKAPSPLRPSDTRLEVDGAKDMAGWLDTVQGQDGQTTYTVIVLVGGVAVRLQSSTLTPQDLIHMASTLETAG